MDKGCVTGTVFLDLRKAFDTVDHLLLLNKLKSLGVARKNLEWFAHISLVEFNNRCVLMHCLSQQKSPWEYHRAASWDHCYSWLYINGIQSELQHSKMTTFADVVVFYCHENSPTILQSKLIM